MTISARSRPNSGRSLHLIRFGRSRSVGPARSVLPLVVVGLGLTLALGSLLAASWLPGSVGPDRILATYGQVAVLVGLLYAAIGVYQPARWWPATTLLTGAVAVGIVAAVRGLWPLHPLVPEVLPLVGGALLLAVLLDAHLALLISGVMALLVGLAAGTGLEPTIRFYALAVTGIVIIWRAPPPLRLLLAGLAVAAVNLMLALVGQPSTVTGEPSGLARLVAASVLYGGLSAGLAWVGARLLAPALGGVTMIQLLELADPSQPLLRRLAREVPGTYHHSLVVSSLAENAARLVGADPLFIRVVALYHDIGKLTHPTAFVENQQTGVTPHEALTPAASAQLIIGHVEAGVGLAQRYHLPRSVIAIIQQHHGTSRVSYFYHRALAAGQPVDERAFRYPGPRPKSKEAGLLLLADAIEATARARYQVKHAGEPGAAVEGPAELVDRIVEERLRDGQLVESGLTPTEVEVVRSSFASVLTTIYHPRIDYPASGR